MSGKEDIKVGDILLCISNEGITRAGTKKVVSGITQDDINLNGDCQTSWVPRKGFPWENYVHCSKIIK